MRARHRAIALHREFVYVRAMTVASAFSRLNLFFCLALLLTGCSRFGQGEVDEERESHFLTGKSRVTSLDYKGAIESFEKAIEVNPRSASAHLELGLLYEEKVNDYADAIHHFQKHLQLRPTSNVGEMVRGHINNCKLELAKTIPFALINSKVQAGIDKLNSDNLALRQQVEELKLKLAQVSSITNRPATVSNITPARPANSVTNERGSAQLEQTVPPSRRPPETGRSAAPAMRSHRVRPGETVASIARQYGLTPQDVLNGNPGLEPRRMKAGQTINIPAKPR
jgi:LysM repeat protein